MQLVTLLTDWGYKDFFSGMVKGKLYSLIPDCQVIDISHGIEPFHVSEAILVTRFSCLDFPKDTIHIIDINSYESDTFSHVVIKHNHQYYICTDNGIPYGVFGTDFEAACRITHVFQDSNFFSFAALDLFAKVAGLLAKKTPLDEIGEPISEFNKSIMSSATYNKNLLSTTVIYIDNYGNAYLNLTYERFMEVNKGRSFSVFIKSRNERISCISLSYADVESGEELVIVSATGYLQIAINQASASKLLGLRLMDIVTFEFKD